MRININELWRPMSSTAFMTAAGAMQRFSGETPGERGRRASVVALVLRTVEAVGEDAESTGFLVRRAEAEVDGLESRGERSYLRRLLASAFAEDEADRAALLAEYAGALEDARRLPEAATVIGLACDLAPARADLWLRAGRIARLSADRERALRLYARAREMDTGRGRIARLAAIGEAVVGPEPEAAVGRVIREAVRSGDSEAAAVGLEERGRLRRAAGDLRGAGRDFAISLARYTDAVDRGRVGHLLADLFVAEDDAAAAGEVLLFLLKHGDRSQRDHARGRLHTIARDTGDRVGARRWRSFEPARLVSLSVRPTRRSAASRVEQVRRWIARTESSPAFPG